MNFAYVINFVVNYMQPIGLYKNNVLSNILIYSSSVFSVVQHNVVIKPLNLNWSLTFESWRVGIYLLSQILLPLCIYDQKIKSDKASLKKKKVIDIEYLNILVRKLFKHDKFYPTITVCFSFSCWCSDCIVYGQCWDGFL